MAGKLIPTAAQDGDGALPSAPPKLGGGAKSRNHLRRMKAKAKKLAEQPIDQPVADETVQGASGDTEMKEEQDEDVLVSIGLEGWEGRFVEGSRRHHRGIRCRPHLQHQPNSTSMILRWPCSLQCSLNSRETPIRRCLTKL